MYPGKFERCSILYGSHVGKSNLTFFSLFNVSNDHLGFVTDIQSIEECEVELITTEEDCTQIVKTLAVHFDKLCSTIF